MTKKASAFTLLEFLLYAGIVAVLLFAATEVILSLMDGRAKIEAIQEVNQNERTAMQIMLQSIKNANAVSFPYPSSTSAVLILQTDSVATSPTIFSVYNQQLQMKEGSAATTTLTSSRVTVPFLSFQNLSATGSPANIQIRLSVSSTNPTNDPDYAAGDSTEGSAAVRRKL